MEQQNTPDVSSISNHKHAASQPVADASSMEMPEIMMGALQQLCEKDARTTPMGLS